jgi:hypothetical protein
MKTEVIELGKNFIEKLLSLSIKYKQELVEHVEIVKFDVVDVDFELLTFEIWKIIVLVLLPEGKPSVTIKYLF